MMFAFIYAHAEMLHFYIYYSSEEDKISFSPQCTARIAEKVFGNNHYGSYYTCSLYVLTFAFVGLKSLVISHPWKMR